MPGKGNKKTTPLLPTKKQGGIPKKESFTGIPKWAPLSVIVFTGLLYLRSLQNGFTFLDDNFYILENPYLPYFNAKNIIAIFSNAYSFNYHPLTTLSNLIEYRLFYLDPLPYHFTNVALHLLNTWLVFKLIEKLSGAQLTALIVSILFAIHPFHVESVVWLSERKDVLYTLFYLLSLLAYLQYIGSGYESKQYGIALIFFLASLLSKSAAVTLPVLLIAIDIYKGRKTDARSLLEKIPFILLSILFGIIAVIAQKTGAINDLSIDFGSINRIFLFTYGLAFYIIEAAFPFNLSAVHYLPNVIGTPLPWYYYVSLPFLILVAWIVARKNKHRKDIIFGISFFLITISVMSQIVPVGSAVVSERYTYIPYIGLFYIAGQCLSAMKKKYLNYAIGVFSLFVVVFSLQTWNRIGVWKDTNVLFMDIVKKNPGNWRNSFIYNSWGNFRKSKGDIQGALTDYSLSIDLYPKYEWAYYNRGLIYDQLGSIQQALSDFNNAVLYNPERVRNYNWRGWEYFQSGNEKAAMLDYNKAISMAPEYGEAYNNRGWAYYKAGNVKSALTDFNKAIQVTPFNAKPYYNRAIVNVSTGNLAGALEDYHNVLKYHPNDSIAYFDRGAVYLELHDSANACKDWKKSLELGYKNVSGMLQQYCH